MCVCVWGGGGGDVGIMVHFSLGKPCNCADSTVNVQLHGYRLPAQHTLFFINNCQNNQLGDFPKNKIKQMLNNFWGRFCKENETILGRLRG